MFCAWIKVMTILILSDTLILSVYTENQCLEYCPVNQRASAM